MIHRRARAAKRRLRWSVWLDRRLCVAMMLVVSVLAACGGRLTSFDGAGDATAPDAATAFDASVPPPIPDATTSDADAAAQPDATIDASDAAFDVAAEAADASADVSPADAADAGCVGVVCNGECVSGRCIVTVATGQGDPFAVAASDDEVFWTNYAHAAAGAGSVMRTPADGGAPVPIATGLTRPRYIAVNAERVYWGDDSGMNAWSRADGTITRLAGGIFPGGIALDSTNLYWTNDGLDGGVMSMPLDGGSPVALITNLQNAELLVVSSTSAYWVNFASYAVYSVPLTGGTRSLFFSDQNFEIAGIGIDGDNLYYTEQSSGGPVGARPLDGGAGRELASNNGTLGVVSDGTYVYYTSPNGNAPMFDGEVDRVAIAGGPPVTLATGDAPAAIAIDARSVCWIGSRSGTVMKLTPR